MALEKVISFVLTMLTSFVYWCLECLKTSPRARVLTRGRKPKSPKKYPKIIINHCERHYILDLRPEQEATKKRSTSGGGFIPRYSIPTIALANVSQLLVTTMRQLTTKCLYAPQEVLLTVLSVTRLGVRELLGESRVDAAEGLADDTYNHYIFDLRPEYGSDIAVILFDVLEANWPGKISEPYFITRRRKRSRRFIKKCGWRLELVNSDRRNKATKKKLLQVKRPKDSCSFSANDNANQSVQSQEQYCSEQGTSSVHQMEEQFNVEQPIQDSDQDVGSVVPMTVPQTTCIASTT